MAEVLCAVFAKEIGERTKVEVLCSSEYFQLTFVSPLGEGDFQGEVLIPRCETKAVEGVMITEVGLSKEAAKALLACLKKALESI